MTDKPIRFYLGDAERGQATVAGVLFILIFVVIAAALTDLYRLQDVRTFAYSAANDAALRGTSLGRDWNQFTATGELTLDAVVADRAAQNALASLMQARGIADYTFQVRVFPASSGGTLSNFPPVARASLFCSVEPCVWTESKPAVGVYIEIPIQPIFFGLINGNQPIRVHAFAAAEVTAQ
ncbi:MAG: hypothetical protein HY327_12720 [Chloroflexi bacterium]|nr:hypothetical protein [Chloroflexota bacterium]